MKLVSLVLLGLSLYSVTGLSAEAEQNCTNVEMNQINYYSVLNVTKDQSVGDFYKQQIEKLEAFSKQHQLQNFKILSQDVSIGVSSYIPTSSDLSISISFESSFDYSLIDKIRNELQPGNISSSRTQTSVCK